MEAKTKWKIAGALVLAWFILRQKGSGMAKARATATGLGTGRFLSQSDARWNTALVGTGPQTYGAVGCVVTAVTIAVNMLKGSALTPDMLQPGKLLTAGDYTGSSISSDTAFAKLGCVVRGRLRNVPHTSGNIATMCALIDATLESGGLAVVRVDYDLSKEGDNHSVVCFAHGAAGYSCADPAGGVEITLDRQLFCQRTSSKQYAATGVQPVFRA